MRKPHPDPDLTHLQKCTCSKDAASRITGIADALNAPYLRTGVWRAR